MLSYVIAAFVAVALVGSSQGGAQVADDARVVATRWVINNEIHVLAKAGLPPSQESLAFCVGTTVKAVEKGSAPTSAEGFWASLTEIKNPSSDFLNKVRDDRFELFGAEACRQNALGAPTDGASGRVTRGGISVGPVFQLESQYVQVPVQIVRHLSAATGWVLQLERVADGWKVVNVRFVWQA